jgi:hypothetical protein
LKQAGTSELLVEHGIRRAMNVILQGDGSPFGVLEVDRQPEGEFSEKDVAFLQGTANFLGMAIEQQEYQRKLQAALARHQILLKEVRAVSLPKACPTSTAKTVANNEIAITTPLKKNRRCQFLVTGALLRQSCP